MLIRFAGPASAYFLSTADVNIAADVLLDKSILVVGQPVAGAVSNGQYTLEVGQVYGLLHAFKGDFNNDFVIDQSDVNVFVNVLLGADTNPVHAYEADFNGDGSVDGRDIGPFVRAMLAL